MKSLSVFSIIFFSFTVKAQILLPFEQNGKWGYINEKSEIVIPAQFEFAKPFYHEVAAVRKNGFYGFIDKHGTLVKEPEYEHTDGFMFKTRDSHPQFLETDVAVVFKDSMAFIINDQFEVIYNFSALDSKNLVGDFFNNELYFYLSSENNSESYILTLGLDSIIIPSIANFSQSGSLLGVNDEDENVLRIINLIDGSSSIYIPRSGYIAELNSSYIHEYSNLTTANWHYYHSLDGTLVDSIDSKTFDIPIEISWRNQGLIHGRDSNGYLTELVILGKDNITTYDTNVVFIFPTDRFGRGFTKHIDGMLRITMSGRETKIYTGQYISSGFNTEYVVVERESEILLIDTALNENSYPKNKANYFFHYIDENGYTKTYRNQDYGSSMTAIRHFVNLNSGFVSKTRFLKIFPFQPKIYFAVREDGTYCYLHVSGEEIEIPYSNLTHNLRISHQLNNHIILLDYARRNNSSHQRISSTGIELQSEYNTYAESISIQIDERLTTWEKDHNINAYQVSLINSSNDTFFLLPGIYSQLKTEIQAKDESGAWISLEKGIVNDRHMWPIEFLPHSKWTWTIPKFEGSFETEMRIVVYGLVKFSNESYIDKNVLRRLRSETFEIYSAPFPGSINPLQFSEEGIYVPYNYFQE